MAIRKSTAPALAADPAQPAKSAAPSRSAADGHDSARRTPSAETKFGIAFAAAGEIEELAVSLLGEISRTDVGAPLRRAVVMLLAERIVEVSRAVAGLDDDERDPTEVAAKIRDGLEALGGWGAH